MCKFAFKTMMIYSNMAKGFGLDIKIKNKVALVPNIAILWKLYCFKSMIAYLRIFFSLMNHVYDMQLHFKSKKKSIILRF